MHYVLYGRSERATERGEAVPEIRREFAVALPSNYKGEDKEWGRYNRGRIIREVFAELKCTNFILE